MTYVTNQQLKEAMLLGQNKPWAERFEDVRHKEARFVRFRGWNPETKTTVGSFQLAELIELNDQNQAPWKDGKTPAGLVARMLDLIEAGWDFPWKRQHPLFCERLSLWIVMERFIDGQRMLQGFVRRNRRRRK